MTKVFTPREALVRYRELGNEIGVLPSVLAAAGIAPTATAAEAIEELRGRVGATVWAEALSAPGEIGASSCILRALTASTLLSRAAAKVAPPQEPTQDKKPPAKPADPKAAPPPPAAPPAKRKPAPAPAQEQDAEECATCGHDDDQHHDGSGPCIVEDCACEAFAEPEEDDAPPSSKPGRRPPGKPEQDEEHAVRGIVRSIEQRGTTASRAQLDAAARACRADARKSGLRVVAPPRKSARAEVVDRVTRATALSRAELDAIYRREFGDGSKQGA